MRSSAQVASDLRSLHKESCSFGVLSTDRAKKRLPVGGNPGKAVDSPANQILKMARFRPSRARLHASFSRGWGVRCSINYSVQDCSLLRLQSFDQRRWSKGSRRGTNDSKGRVCREQEDCNIRILLIFRVREGN